MSIENIIAKNKQWAAQTVKEDPSFFSKLSGIQRPQFLWVGCSDSRVPANQITGTLPGEVFVHRNIANVIGHTDMNALSVIQYAVDVLGIEEIIVCGHYHCGGVMAALSDQNFGLIDNWLCHLKDTYTFHQEKLDKITDPEARMIAFTDLHVQEQVRNLARTTVIQNAWKSGKNIVLHGLVYDLRNGLLKQLPVPNISLSR